MSDAFDASFLAHPAFSVFDQVARERLAQCSRFPHPSELPALTRGLPSLPAPALDFEPEDAKLVRQAGGFDRFIAQSGRIPTRLGSYHDLFGALIWLHFPRLKQAIHRLQLAGSENVRSPRENAATHLDESGVLVVSSDQSVLQALAALEWPELFWQRRSELSQTTRFVCFGHGLLDSLRAPHPKLMSMALCAEVSPASVALADSELRLFLDRELSRRLSDFLARPATLQPLPVLGVPGWHHRQSAEFYGDESYFRRARQRTRITTAAAFLSLD